MRAKSQHPERKNRKVVCENSQFYIFFDELTSEGRTTIRDYLVVAPKRVASNLVTGVAILPIVDGKIGLIRIYRHPIGQYSWEIPRGFIDRQEVSASAAGRELKEETGLDCKSEAIRSLGFITPDGEFWRPECSCLRRPSVQRNGSMRPRKSGTANSGSSILKKSKK
jgi:hypothetical protein